MKNINLILVLLLFAGFRSLKAQTTLQVLTKTIEKTAIWKTGYSLEINGEKAEVEVSPSKNSEISVHAELTAKHPNKDTARLDLENWKFVVSTVGKKIYIRAYIGLKKGQSAPTSNLKAKIVVQVPAACPVSLANKLGKVRLENLTGAVAMTGEFCSFELVNLGGDVWLDTQYGSIEGSGFTGKISLKTNRADVTLSDLRADCSVQSEYGKITVETQSNSGNLAIKGSKSEVYVRIPTDSGHNVHLKSEYGELNAPQNFEKSTTKNEVQQANFSNGVGRPFVSVETTFGKISVEKK
jgi:hypothetical protein